MFTNLSQAHFARTNINIVCSHRSGAMSSTKLGAGGDRFAAAPPPPPRLMGIRKFPEGQWSTGICDCLHDPSNCLITCFCPCITFGRMAEIIDGGKTTCGTGGLIYCALASVGCGWLYACTYRSKLRGLFSLPEAPCADWLVHCCCCACFSLCQEYRELQNRGADPSKGWQANVEKWNRGGLKPPFVAQGMYR